ncbi:MAG: hypothetical protein NC122_09665 [Faecalibacterium sp.]|nr:hypothetical protein [Ruminococcus sp.]MCM1392915.1 hypothetical protein [Ruminococcus sp.]MCM1486457.1 hypothetical protein [Faecalibacterium sp.]
MKLKVTHISIVCLSVLAAFFNFILFGYDLDDGTLTFQLALPQFIDDIHANLYVVAEIFHIIISVVLVVSAVFLRKTAKPCSYAMTAFTIYGAVLLIATLYGFSQGRFSTTFTVDSILFVLFLILAIVLHTCKKNKANCTALVIMSVVSIIMFISLYARSVISYGTTFINFTEILLNVLIFAIYGLLGGYLKDSKTKS